MKTVMFNDGNQDYFIQDFTVYGKYEDDICVDHIYVEDVDGNEVEDMAVLDMAVEHLRDNYSMQLYEMWYENRIAMADYLADD